MKDKEDAECKAKGQAEVKVSEEEAKLKAKEEAECRMEEVELKAKEEIECRMDEGELKAEEDARIKAKEEDVQKLIEKFECGLKQEAEREGMERTAPQQWNTGVGRCSSAVKCCLIM